MPPLVGVQSDIMKTKPVVKLTKRTMAEAFDEWLRLVIKDPDRFESELTTVFRAQRERRSRKPLSYGAECVVILKTLMAGKTI